MQHPNKDAERTTYYRQQASVCSAAALTTTIAEVKQAYLELEQGWRCLAPKPENGSVVSAEPSSPLDADSKLRQVPHGNVAQSTSKDNL
jgi:hypothetical protein